MWRNVLVTVAALMIMSPGARGQQPSAPVAPAGPTTAFVNLSRVSNDYQVGAGDLLAIQVIGNADLTQELRISNSGEISFPMLGLIQVADLTTFEVEDAIASRLREKGLIKDPDVLVFVREYQAKPVYVSGAVVTPGEFVMSQELTASEAVLLAGGLQFNAADEGVIHRRSSGARTGPLPVPESSAGAPDVEVIEFDLRPIKEGRFLENALSLRAGDVIIIPEMRMQPFYVVGELIEPRNFFYPPTKVLTASQAISWAGGPLPTAKMSKGILVRYDENGQRIERKVDYAAILKGKQPDFPIQPNDIIFIPGSRAKTLAHGMLGLADTMTMSAAFRIGRTYQLPDPPPRPEPDR